MKSRLATASSGKQTGSVLNTFDAGKGDEEQAEAGLQNIYIFFLRRKQC